MHLEVYQHRPDVRAVVHAHPPTATGFAVAGIPLDRAVLAEVITTLGSIPIAEYATPSTEELPAAVRKYIKAHDGMLLANHGALTVAGDVLAGLLPDGDDRALREDQPGRADARPREPAVARAKSTACRGCAACTASPRRRRSAPTRRWRPRPTGRWSVRSCRRRRAPARGWCADIPGLPAGGAGEDAEIRLTYRELTALIEDAVEGIWVSSS